MNTRAGFDIQNYLITFMLVVGILVTFGTFAYKTNQNYARVTSSNLSNDFSSTYNKLDTIASETEQTQDSLEQADLGDEDAATQFLGSAYGALKITIPSLAVGQTMMQEAAIALHVPAIWVQIATIALIILFFTTLLFMVFKFRG